MLEDPRGVLASTNQDAALALLETATTLLLCRQAGAEDAVTTALARDPGFATAHLLDAAMALAETRQSANAAARRSLSRARTAIALRGGCRRDRALLSGLDAWASQGDLWRCSQVIAHALRDEPLDLIALYVAQTVGTILGDAIGLRLITEHLVSAWPENAPGRAQVLAALASALCETGDYAAAEQIGRAAVAVAPHDLLASQAVAVALAGLGRVREASAWLGWTTRFTVGRDRFSRHQRWYRALLHLHLGEVHAALDAHDRIMAEDTLDTAGDLVDAVVFLWHLHAVGASADAWRWDDLADMAEALRADSAWALCDVCCVAALAAAGRRDAAEDALRALEAVARERTDTQARALAEFGVRAAGMVLNNALGDPVHGGRTPLTVRGRHTILGGTSAQRTALGLEPGALRWSQKREEWLGCTPLPVTKPLDHPKP